MVSISDLKRTELILPRQQSSSPSLVVVIVIVFPLAEEQFPGTVRGNVHMLVVSFTLLDENPVVSSNN